MSVLRRTERLQRRSPRTSAFRSLDLVQVLRPELAPWLRQEGFKRLGSQAWIQSVGDVHRIVEVQCGMAGWDPRAGTGFVIEFEESHKAARYSGFHRERVWTMLDDAARAEAIAINGRVQQTLPPPDSVLLRSLPASLRPYYLSKFSAPTSTVRDSDVWFRYYDETDADQWAVFLGRYVGAAWARFLGEPNGRGSANP